MFMAIAIKPIELNQVEEVKCMIVTVCKEIWQVPEEVIKSYDSMFDIDNVQSHYFDNNGTFLVITDDAIVGSGAIRHLIDDICELKRMWLLKEYRGQGLGSKIAQMLLDFAKKTGYNKVRLDLTDKQKQTQALKLYNRLGFYFIKRYNDSPKSAFMEKRL